MNVDHTNERKQVLQRLYIATALCSLFLVVEVVGGLLAGSLAILSDAAHLFADIASFAVSIAATFFASMPATRAHTYGLKRSESLGALVSMMSLAYVTVALAYEALRRLISAEEEPVDGKVMVTIASIGVIVNIALAFVLGENHVHLPGSSHGHSHDHGPACHDEEHGRQHHPQKNHESTENHPDIPTCVVCTPTLDHHTHEHGHQEGNYSRQDPGEAEMVALIKVGGCQDHDHTGQHRKERNINLHAAYLHALGDLALSIGVLFAGLVIWIKPEWQKLDPIITILFSCMIFYSTLGVMKSSVSVLLEATPSGISWQEVFEDISSIPFIHNVHDLHIWSISHGEAALTVHCFSNAPTALSEVYKVCQRHGISHATIQIQPSEEDCATCTTSCMSRFESCCTSEGDESIAKDE